MRYGGAGDRSDLGSLAWSMRCRSWVRYNSLDLRSYPPRMIFTKIDSIYQLMRCCSEKSSLEVHMKKNNCQIDKNDKWHGMYM
jgi:hypothetical protein